MKLFKTRHSGIINIDSITRIYEEIEVVEFPCCDDYEKIKLYYAEFHRGLLIKDRINLEENEYKFFISNFLINENTNSNSRTS